jgi:hypothetical protein
LIQRGRSGLCEQSMAEEDRADFRSAKREAKMA